AQDWDEKDWVKHMTISKPLYSGNKAIVTIRMGSRIAPHDGARTHLIVILKKIGKKWLITDVADANDRQE
ncbi:MAG: YbjP/YqhG family protein, partial [Burkholderiaceae bacterium]|nr:YbjP/YqhG family protein [Burkholderiaceae bacterium]MDR2153900.1 YbjP/YqhG family protein [Burkholderiaceae bacterium]